MEIEAPNSKIILEQQNPTGELGIKLRCIPLKFNKRNGFTVATVHYSLHPKSKIPGWLDKERQAMPQAMWDREMEIKYASLGGELIWPSFTKERNVVPARTKMDERWWRFRFIDYGHRNPTCCLWIACDFDGNAYIYREWYHPTYQQMQTASAARIQRFNLTQHCEIINLMSRDETYVQTLIDPQAGEMTFGESDTKKTVLDKMRDAGLTCAKARKSSEGLDTIEAMWREGKLFILENCTNTILEIENYRFKDFSPHMQDTRNLAETPIKKNDHACNCLKFFGNNKLKETPRPVFKSLLPPGLARPEHNESKLAKADIAFARRKRRITDNVR